MNLIPLLVAAFAVLPVFGMAVWVWLAMSSANEDIGTFVSGDRIPVDD